MPRRERKVVKSICCIPYILCKKKNGFISKLIFTVNRTNVFLDLLSLVDIWKNFHFSTGTDQKKMYQQEIPSTDKKLL